MLECIYCSSKNIKKSIMSPMISGGKPKDEYIDFYDKVQLKEKHKLLKLRKHIEKILNLLVINLARKLEKFIMIKIQKNIYGTTTPEEK